MKKTKLSIAAAVIIAAACANVIPASADNLMQISLKAEQNAVTTDQLATGDFVVHGGMYIDHYTGISSIRTILKSDDPISIENGDFAWEEGKTDEQLRLVEAYNTAMYNQYFEETGTQNFALFYAKNSELGEVAKLRDPSSPLIEFDIRVPQNTPAGDYRCYISEKETVNSIGQIDHDFICIRAKDYIYPGTDLDLKPLVFSVYTRGDTDCNGTVNALDAQRALLCALETSVLEIPLSDEELKELTGTPHVGAAKLAMDINGNGSVDSSDAQAILQYYLDGMLGNPQAW